MLVATNTERSIRLFGGSDTSSGIVEIFYNGKWGMVCEGGRFGLNEARAVCNELDFDPSQTSILSTSRYIDMAQLYQNIKGTIVT